MMPEVAHGQAWANMAAGWNCCGSKAVVKGREDIHSQDTAAMKGRETARDREWGPLERTD